MTSCKKVILVMVLMILVNDAVLIGGYFYAKTRLVAKEPEQIEEAEEETEAAEEERPSNYISIDECMGSYHMKGFSIDGKTYLNRVPCDCDKEDEEDEKSVG